MVEVANLEAPCIVVVDNLVDRVQGVHVWGHEMMCRRVSKDAKPVIDGHIAAKWFNVDLEDDRTDATRSWRAPPCRKALTLLFGQLILQTTTVYVNSCRKSTRRSRSNNCMMNHRRYCRSSKEESELQASSSKCAFGDPR